ncbi:hypothetical protein BHY07_05670 [Bacillus subtilis subsp. subtilis]|uniref:Uncharacterized protein YhgB n=3 Tax=Bacillus subtilis subsp. subtilis TaxID=135461 RepID=YHGB_BACSU|nr:hypothetical protein [Bacillus subtilis]NP_388890.1 hypothetical protein BSU_10090 [Bacillus subtilis subsp. subtilis str. 168]P38048.2 RecName: Full=Uncharacterized protein YhgB [Bacillus subtilis subsp. subtilis str. 168]AIC39395.1 hypothetical protein BSUA_01106 [Bacillus subtilis subsp. subtilis str. JH642 substr. AG174]AIC43627.1 yhgB [Bacillus subtilis subsp. subtilis str. AG1839]AIY92293.1 hypothetical protein QU35_05685 [Bacillus subtilis subsp. subtilis str. 168]AIY96605.1 hypothe
MKHTCPVCGFKDWLNRHMIMKAIILMKSARAAVFSSDLMSTRCSTRITHIEPSESIIAYRKNWLAEGCVIFSPECFPKHLQKANRGLRHHLIEQLKQINVHLPS